MKVILQKPIESLGVPGDLVEVADGYARNFLVPRGLAVRATKGVLRHAESLRRSHQTKVAKEKVAAEVVASKLTATAIRIKARVGEEGRLFGSVTASDVAEGIEGQVGVRVDRHDIYLDEPIRSVGVHEVRVHLFPEVDPVISLEVEPTE